MGVIEVFDPGRAMLEDYLDRNLYPARLMVNEAQSLEDSVSKGELQLDTRLLTFEYAGNLYVFPMKVVLSYNVIQGQIDDHEWMMTFCNACNTGMVFNPVVDGQLLHFQRRGSYDGLLLIWDEETNSYWQHVTGKCLYGSSVSKQLDVITTTRQMSVAEALVRTTPPLLLTNMLTPEQEKLSRMMEKMRANPEKVEDGIAATIGVEDTRRPRFELGLGVWNLDESCFFPLAMLYAHDRAWLTEFAGRSILIYQEQDAVAPVATYIDTRSVYWEADMLRLDKGAYIQHDIIVSPDGRTSPLDRPMQLLMRWYGFALTFPGCKLPNL